MDSSASVELGQGKKQAERQRDKSVQPRGPGGRFAVLHGAYAGRRQLRRPDRRRSLVKLAEDLRLAYLLGRGYPSWETAPEPLRGLIELAAEVRIFRRLLASPLWRGEAPPMRWLGVAELERRVLVALGIEPTSQALDVAALLAAMQKSDEVQKTAPGRVRAKGRAP